MYILFRRFTHLTTVRFFTRPYLNVKNERKTEQDLNKYHIFKPDFSSCARGSSSSEFTKRVARNCPTKHVGNQKYQVTFSYHVNARYFFFILLSINACIKFCEKKNFKKTFYKL